MKTLMAMSGLGILLVLAGGTETDATPWGRVPALDSRVGLAVARPASNNDVIQAY